MKKQKQYDSNQAQKAAHRQALINAGLYGIHKEKVVPSGKAYKRHSRSGRSKIED